MKSSSRNKAKGKKKKRKKNIKKFALFRKLFDARTRKYFGEKRSGAILASRCEPVTPM